MKTHKRIEDTKKRTIQLLEVKRENAQLHQEVPLLLNQSENIKAVTNEEKR